MGYTKAPNSVFGARPANEPSHLCHRARGARCLLSSFLSVAPAVLALLADMIGRLAVAQAGADDDASVAVMVSDCEGEQAAARARASLPAQPRKIGHRPSHSASRTRSALPASGLLQQAIDHSATTQFGKSPVAAGTARSCPSTDRADYLI